MHSHWVQNCLISTPLTHKPNSIFGTLNTIHIVVKLPTREKKPYIHRRANRRKNSNLFMVQYILRQSMCINECKLFDWANVSGYDSGNNIFSFNETHIMPWQYWQFENKKYETKSMFAYCERGCENGGRRKEWEGGNASSMVKNGVFATPYATSEVPRPLCTPMTTSKTLRYQQILRNLAHTPKLTPQRIHRKQFYFVRFLFKFNRCTDSFQSLTFSGV